MMAPEYDKLAEEYKTKRDDVLIARLEGSLNEDISMIYEIFSFPRVIMFFPGSIDIKNAFRGQRVASIIDSWIDTNAPRIQKNLKMLVDDKDLNKPNNVADSNNNIDKALSNNINNNHSTNANKKYDLEEEVLKGKNNSLNNNNLPQELEFIKIEMLNLKNKVINLEHEVEILKNRTKDYASGNSRDNGSESNEDKIKNLKIIGQIKKFGEGFFDKLTLLDILFYIGIFSVIIGAVITIKKVILKKKGIVSNDHEKVHV